MKIYYLYALLSGYREFIHIINYIIACYNILYHIILNYSCRHVMASFFCLKIRNYEMTIIMNHNYLRKSKS